MLIQELLEGKKVKATKDCSNAEEGEIYEVKDGKIMGCSCAGSWELLSPLSYKPKPHKHILKCDECGEIIKY